MIIKRERFIAMFKNDRGFEMIRGCWLFLLVFLSVELTQFGFLDFSPDFLTDMSSKE